MTPRDPAGSAPARESTVTETQAYISRLIRDAENGDRIVITRHGKPVAQLVPYGLPVDDLATFEALMGDAQALMDRAADAIADARDFGRRHHVEEPKPTAPATPIPAEDPS